MTSLKLHAWLMLRNRWGLVLGGGGVYIMTSLKLHAWLMLRNTWCWVGVGVGCNDIFEVACMVDVA